MSRKEYKDRVRKVKKMTREGLREENPLDGSVKTVGAGSENRIRGSDDFDLKKKPEEKTEYYSHVAEKETHSARKKGKKRRIYRQVYGGPGKTLSPKARETEPAERTGKSLYLHEIETGRGMAANPQKEAEEPEKKAKETDWTGRTSEIPLAPGLFHRTSPKRRGGGRNRENFRKEGQTEAPGKRQRLIHGESAGIGQRKENAGTRLRSEGKIAAAALAAGQTLVSYSAYQADGNAAVDSVEAGYQAADAGISAGMRFRRSVKRSRYREGENARVKQMAFRERSRPAAEEGGIRQWHILKGDAAERKSRKKKYRKRYQKIYRNAGIGNGFLGKTAGLFTGKKASAPARKIISVVFGKQKLYLIIGILVLGLMILVSVFAAAGVMSQAVGGVVASTTYPSEDADIYAAENAYQNLETALNRQINQMEITHPGYDEYRYNVDEISHNPYQLTSFLSAKYGNYIYSDVEPVLLDLFRQQYTLTVQPVYEEVTETRTVQVGESLGTVVTSGYCNCVLCCGIWAGGNTASGVPPASDHTIAVDASDPIVPMGTKVVMNGVEYTVEDTGNFKRYGVDFDIYYDSHAEALAHGHQSVEAYLSDSNGSSSIEVTETTTKKILNITLKKVGFHTVAGNNLTRNQRQMYDLYNATLGNRSYLFSAYDSASDDYASYTPPAEALSDEKFANMLYEAEKYLGVPYVWGGYSPAGFDCSGFLSYVINYCGNGWNVGRLTANGLKDLCTPVSPEEAKPGDLIFFQGTYQTSGASHVGMIVGDGMMIHCGSPVQYTSYETSYWQSHFLSVGRLP